MMHNSTSIETFLVPDKRVHLAGIGGVSMCPLAEVLQGMGLHVQGSDMNDSATVEHLRSLGTVSYTHLVSGNIFAPRYRGKSKYKMGES